MAEKGKTVRVKSTIHLGGLKAGEVAEVDDTEWVRNVIKAGYWEKLVQAEFIRELKEGRPSLHGEEEPLPIDISAEQAQEIVEEEQAEAKGKAPRKKS